MRPGATVYVAGGDTLLGTALRWRLRAEGAHLVGEPPDEPDLTCAEQVDGFFREARPEYVFVAAGKSGGIHANRTRPAELMLDNLLAAAHVLPAAHRYRVRKLLYLLSSCAYPSRAPQPLRAESLLAGPLEPTSAAYATAKLAGWQLCEAFRRQHGADFVAAVPADTFGPHDDFSPDGGHVLPGLLRRAHDARRRGDPALTVWGTGAPRREFLYSRDLADACVFVMRHYEGPGPINLGGGAELSVADAARAAAEVVGYAGRLVFDATRPDGAPRKALDAAPLRALGWRPATDFRAALAETYSWFLRHVAKEGPEHVRAAV